MLRKGHSVCPPNVSRLIPLRSVPLILLLHPSIEMRRKMSPNQVVLPALILTRHKMNHNFLDRSMGLQRNLLYRHVKTVPSVSPIPRLAQKPSMARKAQVRSRKPPSDHGVHVNVKAKQVKPKYLIRILPTRHSHNSNHPSSPPHRKILVSSSLNNHHT